MLKFNQFLKESKIYSLNPDNSKTFHKINEVKFVNSELQKSRGYCNVVEVSDEFHNKYKSSKGQGLE